MVWRIAIQSTPLHRIRSRPPPFSVFCSSSRRQYSASTAASQPWGPPSRGTKVYVCMSGGVDSSVCARLLLEEGYDIAPIYMRNWDTLHEDLGSGGCEWEQDWAEVETICRQSLGGVKPKLLDLSREYWSEVFQTALDEWEKGLTPNPDVTCNRMIKFGTLPERLLASDPDAWVATGHYARLLPSQFDSTEPALHRGSFGPKDQSYYLSTVPIAAFRRTLFPLGTMSKDFVKELAKKWNLHTALARKESMGICFVGVRKSFATGFLDSYLQPHHGNIVTEDGQVVGTHSGIWSYTEGEKARLPGFREKMYVGRKNIERNEIVVVPASSAMLRCVGVKTDDFRWISGSHPDKSVLTSKGWKLQAQTRSLPTGALSNCVVRELPNDTLSLELDTPIIGVSPGQAVVLYDGDRCFGGGTISSVQTLLDRT